MKINENQFLNDQIQLKSILKLKNQSKSGKK